MYRKRKAARDERKRAALEWLAEHPDIAQRVEAAAATYVSWRSL
jgi:hypothetical protein